ncbi:DCL family protein [Sulfurospirillum deleyianum]|uniref:DUF3223 domain-containing protein n=1 Tax=Sulfurospirillum deleyianum (strain ATCC 51133 / DSM 6946 / 5175) TaxID=525898 RepID=D1B4A2_SULD5|nr:DCL family protein [Sulfurospirillum deleyianum]ACZ12922.1 hypothetical protein Sdel_1907 [Sulfurospirillum deleyianum DSM 6946]
MSRFTIKIGNQEFTSKTQALTFYKIILNAYKVGEELNRQDFASVKNLVYRDFENEEIEAYEKETGDYLKSVTVDLHPDFRGTQCFFLLYQSGKKALFGYRLAINNDLSNEKFFSRACRFTIANRLRDFKKHCFKNRPVKCALTNEIIEWEECQIDHKSPLTFSVIVKSFIIANKLDLSTIKYGAENGVEYFLDEELAQKFDLFHKEMAVLRILSTKENNKRASSARIKPTKKDGVLK